MGRWLWSREHYQFFPIVLLGGAVFAWLRLVDAKWPETPRITFRVIFYGLCSAALFSISVLTKSHWLGTLSFVGTLWTAVWYLGGSSIACRLRGPVLVLLLALPLPLNLDVSLIIGMQKLASSAASTLLDQRNIIHGISGVAIRTVDKEFMVEEACSGIHSMFSCVTAMVFWSAFFRYGVIRLILTVTQTIGWVLIANSLRVFTVIYAHSRWGMALDEGIGHEVLGMCTYLGALTMALSTDQLLRFLIPYQIRLFEASDLRGGYDSPKGGSGYFDEPAQKVLKNANRFMDKARFSDGIGANLPLVVVILIFVPLAGLSIVNAFSEHSSSSVTQQQFSDSLNTLVADDLLPQKIGKWELQNVNRVERPVGDLQGATSVVWTYSGNGLTAQFSIDGRYPDWHDLSYCYTALGWKMLSVQNNNSLEEETKYTQLKMYSESADFASVYFACVDSRFESVTPPPERGSALRVLVQRLRSGAFLSEKSQTISPPVIQFQLMASGKRELMNHEEVLLNQLFKALGSIALQRMKEAA